MSRSLALWFAPLMLAGCHNSPQAIDPFLPSARVPPPGTGAVGTPAPAPYYSAPSATAPAAGAPYTPPGGNYDYTPPANGPVGTPYQGEPNRYPADRIPMTNRDSNNRQSSNLPAAKTKPDAIRSRLAAASSVPGHADEADANAHNASVGQDSENRVVPASHTKVVKVIRSHSEQHDEAASVAAAAEQEPRKLPEPDDAVDIMDLPPAGAATIRSRSAQRIASSNSGKVIRASHTEPAAAASTGKRPQVDPFPAQRYAHSPGYKKLNGQLEYSLADRRWKLRYIPIDGDTDSYGGSVVLAGTVPQEFQAGDFVTVEGSLAGDAAPGEFAPAYQFDKIEPLAD